MTVNGSRSAEVAHCDGLGGAANSSVRTDTERRIGMAVSSVMRVFELRAECQVLAPTYTRRPVWAQGLGKVIR